MSDRFELQREIDRLARIDFGTFVYRAAPIVIGEMLLPNWHIDVLIRAAQRVADGDTRHLLACLPPRYLKTYIFSLCLPAWLMGRNPKTKIISASYGMSLAEKFNLDVLALMTSPWYRRVFPHTRLNPRKMSQTEITTTAGGYRLASSVGGTLTGRGADIIIVDDPMKADEAHSETARENCKSWFFRAAGTRLNNPKKGAFIVVAQRLHADDLPGELIEHGTWDEVIVPAVNDKRRLYDIVKDGKRIVVAPGAILQPSRHDAAMLAEEKKKMGDHDFEAQFNQNPLPPGGAVFKAEWFGRYDEPPTPAQVEVVIQSWDTAFETEETNDYSVCTTWAVSGQRLYLLDVFRERLPFWQLENQVYALKKRFAADAVIMEKAGAGRSVLQNIRQRDGHRWLIAKEAEHSKIVRAEAQSPKVQQGRVWLPKEAAWLVPFENEVLAFPHTKHDDQVDAMSQFLLALDLNVVERVLRGAFG